MAPLHHRGLRPLLWALALFIAVAAAPSATALPISPSNTTGAEHAAPVNATVIPTSDTGTSPPASASAQLPAAGPGRSQPAIDPEALASRAAEALTEPVERGQQAATRDAAAAMAAAAAAAAAAANAYDRAQKAAAAMAAAQAQSDAQVAAAAVATTIATGASTAKPTHYYDSIEVPNSMSLGLQIGVFSAVIVVAVTAARVLERRREARLRFSTSRLIQAGVEDSDNAQLRRAEEERLLAALPSPLLVQSSFQPGIPDLPADVVDPESSIGSRLKQKMRRAWDRLSLRSANTINSRTNSTASHLTAIGESPTDGSEHTSIHLGYDRASDDDDDGDDDAHGGSTLYLHRSPHRFHVDHRHTTKLNSSNSYSSDDDDGNDAHESRRDLIDQDERMAPFHPRAHSTTTTTFSAAASQSASRLPSDPSTSEALSRGLSFDSICILDDEQGSSLEEHLLIL
ncbi:uncharacterized protein MONBRDRAFT_9327 [Monosiga brevicollis MX1]|uniref:Uncharacterized protein n=1 Tax=Monosiga brevicollis TaxID=81824 RepID=A9V2T0_MONBE|nr:uncharacterized protein MONBRDRAFT_9327 [Monosiga brevicollis MX1]EDQ88067.1 predicted protein [Monosiga brevicollis MX1]|eukprot:XP_001747143.1 hypothetical protein [Monosiga brevicollis MX1]